MSDAHLTPLHAWRVIVPGWIVGTALQLQQQELWPVSAWAGFTAALLSMAWVLCALRKRSWSVYLLRVGWALWAAGMAFAMVSGLAQLRLQERMPPELEGRSLDVVGVVSAMPQRGESGLRFRFTVESAQLEGRKVQVPHEVYLSWYAGSAWGQEGAPRAVPPLQAGERWQWRVRLKAAHGHMNPGGFDYELWLWEQGLQATGYVRTGAQDPLPVRTGQTHSHPVEWARQSVRDAIMDRFSSGGPSGDYAALGGVVAALVTGDQSAIERNDWDVFRATGVAHLMSISGLHVTLFAWLASAFIGAVWRRSALWGWRWCALWPAPQAAWVGGVLLATAYALFSGWGLPAQRTVWMLALVGLLRAAGRMWPWPWVWLLALGVVVTWDPWALYQPGFWLSFVAVGVLLATSVPMSDAPILVRFTGKGSPWLECMHQSGGFRRFWGLLREQWVVTWALTPLSVLFFGQMSVVGLLANLVAIPWVTLVVTPLAMLGVLWSGAWTVAVWALQPLHALLQWLATVPGASLQVAQPPMGVALLALAGGLWMALPWPWRLRCLGIPLLVPALGWQVPRPMMGHFEVWAPDVGQGNVVWVRTARHSLLYDAGPRYSIDSDAGHRVIVPWLRRWHERLDLLVLSHRDSDHTGGAAALLAQQNDLPLLSSLEAEHPLHLAAAGSQRCAAGQSWAWDGVQFEVLHPAATDDVPHARSNALSCVLRIRNGSQTVLLTGDIEAPQELALLQRAAPALKADVLLVPHHGSKTSSTDGFIDAVAPRWAWVQAGYRNRFGHPASVVVERYRQRQIQLLDSVHCGAMHWRSDRPDQVHCERDLYRYWHHKAP